MTHTARALAASGVLLALSANPVWAQKIDEAGIDSVVRDNKAFEVEKDHVVVLINEKGISISDDFSHPIYMTIVDCVGMFEEFPDKTYKGNGYCTNTDKDGDKALLVGTSARTWQRAAMR